VDEHDLNATAYRRRADVLWRRSVDAILCLPPGAPEPVTIAGTGPELWDLLAAPHSLATLAAELSARHRTDPDLVAADMRPVLQRLAALGVIEPVL
jgi:Coenzyme PQQ synthesis protein D (PqqD)